MFPNQWSLHTRIHDDNTSAGDPTAGRQRRVPDHPVPEDQQHLHRWGEGEGSLSMSAASLDSSAIIILSGLTCVQNKIYGLAKITYNFVSEAMELKSRFNKVY